jgi:dUTP pyrophosphatase
MSETTIPYTTNGIAFCPDGDPANYELNGPKKAHADDAAYDLRAAEDVSLLPGTPTLVKTGIRIALPSGYAGLVLPRSGLALKHGVTVLNAPGLIDPGYRGEVGVILYLFLTARHLHQQLKDSFFDIERGDRIAQLLIVRTADVNFRHYTPRGFEPVTPLTERGEGGFGSTGR